MKYLIQKGSNSIARASSVEDAELLIEEKVTQELADEGYNNQSIEFLSLCIERENAYNIIKE
jgi:hypothetical protein